MIHTAISEDAPAMAVGPTGMLIIASVVGSEDDLAVTAIRVHATGIEVVAP